MAAQIGTAAICDSILGNGIRVELAMGSKQLSVPVERIEKAILLVRGQKVMLDSYLARLYGVTTKRLNEQVRRKASRFPADFMFQLDEKEASALR